MNDWALYGLTVFDGSFWVSMASWDGWIFSLEIIESSFLLSMRIKQEKNKIVSMAVKLTHYGTSRGDFRLKTLTLSTWMLSSQPCWHLKPKNLQLGRQKLIFYANFIFFSPDFWWFYAVRKKSMCACAKRCPGCGIILGINIGLILS